MPASDVLRNLRGKGYSDNSKPSTEKGMDSGEPNSTSRIIKLSDDEQKYFADSHPGEDLACEVHGSLESDGHFHVMTVSPLNGESYGEENQDDMAKQVMTRVQPNVQPSPS